MIPSRKDIQRLIFGDGRASRFTQDSPVYPEVWQRFLLTDGSQADLLLTPHRHVNSSVLLLSLRERLRGYGAASQGESQQLEWRDDQRNEPPSVVSNEAVVAAVLRFDELIHAAIPLTQWWCGGWAWPKGASLPEAIRGEFAGNLIQSLARAFEQPKDRRATDGLTADLVWFAEIIGTVAHLHHLYSQDPGRRERQWELARGSEPEKQEQPSPALIAERAVQLMYGMPLPGKLFPGDSQPPLWSVSLNRTMETSIFRSTATIKADAAGRLFQINASHISWAVIDSGVDARHPALGRRDPRTGQLLSETEAPGSFQPQHTRVAETYDFTRIRALMDPDLDSMHDVDLKEAPTPDALRALRRLKLSLRTGRAIDWGEWMPFLRVTHDDAYAPPQHPHGTHVAGILASDWRSTDLIPPPDGERALRGVCPDLKLYDLRVLDGSGHGSEYTVMAAMQFVRHMNSHKDQPVIHGVNLSLSTPHDVANFACGRTPVCDECERLIGNGVVVVVAAGNSGYRKGVAGVLAAGYQESTITDPGNAEAVITVGSTHRFMPHAYGVSYFSSRGPTGDGRYKPDLLAPGEKIKAPVPNAGADTMDGTSMAAPHVSGAAALLMARHTEFMGQPARIKEILCKTATDLGRDRYYQGYGIVDILRALQSI